MCSIKNNLNKYLVMIIKYVLAISFYLLVMKLLGPLISPIFRNIFDIKRLHLLAYSFAEPFNFITTYYKASLGTVNSILQYAIYLVMFLGLMGILLKDLHDDFIDYKTFKEDRERSLLISFLIYFGLSLFTGLLVIVLSNKLGVHVESQNQADLESIASSSMLSYWTLAITVVIMGPLVEELIFRKSLFKIIPNDIAAIIISSILFGLMHTINFDYSIKELIVVTLPYLSSGIAFGICYKLTDHNIIMCYALHAALNLFSLFMMLY